MAGYHFSSHASRTALVGVLSAGSLVFLWLACIVPSGRLGLDAVSGLFPMMAVMASGRAAGYLCWAASGLLGVILLPDKGIAMLYLTFFGLYPVLKSCFERQERPLLAWAMKLGYFNIVLAVSWFFLRAIFLPKAPAWLNHYWMVLLLGNCIFAAYDIGLSRLIFGVLGRLNAGGKNRK